MLPDEIDNEVGAPKEPTICRKCRYSVRKDGHYVNTIGYKDSTDAGKAVTCSHPAVKREFVLEDFINGAGKFRRVHSKDILEIPLSYKYDPGMREIYIEKYELADSAYPECKLINDNGQCELYEEYKTPRSPIAEWPNERSLWNLWGIFG
jgi:hypothetical protein